jgi:hypothetical protein
MTAYARSPDPIPVIRELQEQLAEADKRNRRSSIVWGVAGIVVGALGVALTLLLG